MADYCLDYKAEIWFRIPIGSKEALEKVKHYLEQNLTPGELFNELDLTIDEDLGQCEPLYETEEFIDSFENDGQSTIEVYERKSEGDKLLWDNSYSSDIVRALERRNLEKRKD